MQNEHPLRRCSLAKIHSAVWPVRPLCSCRKTRPKLRKAAAPGPIDQGRPFARAWEQAQTQSVARPCRQQGASCSPVSARQSLAAPFIRLWRRFPPLSAAEALTSQIDRRASRFIRSRCSGVAPAGTSFSTARAGRCFFPKSAAGGCAGDRARASAVPPFDADHGRIAPGEAIELRPHARPSHLSGLPELRAAGFAGHTPSARRETDKRDLKIMISAVIF
jgi:hypothetical protein